MRSIIAVLCFSMLGCSVELTEESVTQFVDAADRAFLEGRAADVCAMRASDFTLDATEFRLTQEIVADLASAEAVAAERHERGQRNQGTRAVLDTQTFCQMAYEAREFYQHASMERGPLVITIAPDQSKAVVRAHYTVWEPVYEESDDPDGERVQTATRQSETDDESIIVIEAGELKFASTRSITKSFYVAPRRS